MFLYVHEWWRAWFVWVYLHVCVYVSVCKKVQIYTYSWIVCVSRHGAETELEAADSRVRWSDSLSGKFTLHYTVVYTVG